MNCLSSNKQKLIEQLRFALPLKARARPPLIERLRKTISLRRREIEFAGDERL